MKKARQFGETVEGYDIPVLNEREIKSFGRDSVFFPVPGLDAGLI